MKFEKRLANRFSPVIAICIIAPILGMASVAFASLTFSTTTVFGNANLLIDASGTIAVGSSTATAITIGNNSSVTSFSGNVGIGTNSTTANLQVEGTTLLANLNAVRFADQFPGTTIVEKIQAAVNDCGSNGCTVYVPAGSFY